MSKLWTEEEKEVLKTWYGRIIAKEIHEIYLPNRSLGSIFIKAQKLGLKSNLDIGNAKKYTHNDFYFQTLNSENCYWAGFIAADGNVRSCNNSLKIKLALVDKFHLEKFRDAIKFSGIVTEGIEYDKRLNNGFREYAQILIYSSKQILDDLKNNFNIVPAKTLILRPPSLIDEDLIRAFIRGYFDGDGCLSKNNNKWEFSFSGTLEVLEWIKKQIHNFIHQSADPNILSRGNIFNLKYGGNYQVKYITDWLYKDSIVQLDRKYELYQQINNKYIKRTFGIHYNKREKKYQVYIGGYPKRKHLGYFKDKRQAMLIYNEAALKLYGQKAKLNEI